MTTQIVEKTKLEEYLDSIEDKYVDQSLLERYEEFGYEYNDFKIVIEFLFEKVYNKSFAEKREKRLGQMEFSNIIKEKYKTCIITNSIDCECQAAHIVELHDGGTFGEKFNFFFKATLSNKNIVFI